MIGRDQTQVVKIKERLRKGILKSIKEQGLSQGDVGKLIGMARNNVNTVLRGTEKRVSIDQFIRIANGIGIKIDLIMREPKKGGKKT